MRAIEFDGMLHFNQNAAEPTAEGEALVRVIYAGICNTDLEITKGYAGFKGILGHEFVGIVEESTDKSQVGRRVAGEINTGCGQCGDCQGGDSRHCPDRTVLGIKGRSGAFADQLSLPSGNLICLPDSISDIEVVFVEPLAAACRILEQLEIGPDHDVAVIGDGKLGQLVVRALASTGCKLTLIGKHDPKLKLAAASGAKTILVAGGNSEEERARKVLGSRSDYQFDVVIESSGSQTGIRLALLLIKPRGVIVLKSTTHGPSTFELSPAVVNEITIIGSRCGRFEPAIDLLARKLVDVKPLVTEVLPIEDWKRAFQIASQPDSMKVVLAINPR